MTSKNLHTLSDEALIKAHLEAAESDGEKGSLNSTEAGRLMLEAGAERRASIAAAAIELWIGSGSVDPGKIASALLRANQKDWTAHALSLLLKRLRNSIARARASADSNGSHINH
jgi:hypothetical protein